MNLMNLIRSILSLFVGALVILAFAGWIWAGDQPAAKMIGARTALAVCGLSSVACLWLLWREKPSRIST